MFTIPEIKNVWQKISGDVIQTPLIPLLDLSSQINANVFLKLENTQVGGSIKTRAAFTKVALASIADKKSGFSTASSGNHGISMSLACKKYGVPLYLFLPENTPTYKIDKLKALGTQITLFGHSWDDADSKAREFAQLSNVTYIHAFEDIDILRGHATAAFEVIQQKPDVDTIVCSIGGGGIISSFAEIIKAHSTSAKCYGVETEGAHSIRLSLLNGKPSRLSKITSVAQSIAVQSPTDFTFKKIVEKIDGVAMVSDYEAQQAQREIYSKVGQLIELAASCSVAAVAMQTIPNLQGRNIVILACGGNTDEKSLGDEILPQLVENAYLVPSLAKI